MANRNLLNDEILIGVACPSEQETRQLGRDIAASLTTPTLFSLEGPLGAGKTCFVKGLAEGFGIDPACVSSPTFTLVHEYEGGRIPLVHFDFYRIELENELISLGFEDYLAEPIVAAVEWGGKFPNALPAGTWRLSFSIKNDTRIIRAELMP